MKKILNKKPVKIIIGVILASCFILGITYALWQIIITETNPNLVKLGCFETTFDEGSGIASIGAFPMSDVDGKQETPYTFTITNVCNTPAYYQVNLDIIDVTPLDPLSPMFIKAVLDDNTPKTLIESNYEEVTPTVPGATTSYKLEMELLGKGEQVTYDLRLWIDESAPLELIKNKAFESKIVVITTPGEVARCDNSSLDITVDRDVNMIPVSYENGITVKADVTNVDCDYQWYDYETFKWANVVLVEANGINSRETYKSAIPGTPIEEADILAYLVYVPRYKYELFNVEFGESPSNKEGIINVAFENKTVAKSNGSTNGSWLTHPAFTFGTTELNGIWVGKFETSGYMGDAPTATCINTGDCNNTNMIPVVKPNVISMRSQSVSNQFATSLKFKSNAMYGINASSIDSHMMKNMEWGAVAYLSQSIYGKQGNPLYEGDLKEIAINNSSGYITGRSAGAPGTTNIPLFQTFFGVGSNTQKWGTAGYYAWDDSRVICVASCLSPSAPLSNYGLGAKEAGKGAAASTTGTQYGIYDMSGGASEYVMGNMAANGQSVPGPINPGFSGFTGVSDPDPKYYNSYTYGTSYEDFTRSQLGDATGETREWYGNWAAFAESLYGNWFVRDSGAADIEAAGAFCFYADLGDPTQYYTWRLSLVVE